MTEYPDYGRLLENISAVHGDLSAKEKVIAFLAYSLGAVDGELFKGEELLLRKGKPSIMPDAINLSWRIEA